MRAVKSADTAPEMIVRRTLHGLGARYRLHLKDLPGKPDIVMRPRRKAIFVHGCFWHGHDCKRGARVPKTNQDYWVAKVGRNKTRDRRNLKALRQEGWKVLVVWECQTKDQQALRKRLARFLES